jgi:multidrug resistance efflux pump
MLLDDSALQEQFRDQKIKVDQARAASIQANQTYQIQISQNESDIALAQTTLRLAELDYDKYVYGDYEQLKKDIEGRMSLADSDLQTWLDRVAWSERMVKKGYISGSQAQSERSKLQNAEITMQRVAEELRVLEKYTRKREETRLKDALTEAKRALERVKNQASAKEIANAIDRTSKQSVYDQELTKMEEIQEEIRKCTITAPKDGMVVYYVPESSRFGGSSSRQTSIAQGEPVTEGQKLMRIPNLRQMQVEAKVHEAQISRVRGEEYVSTGYYESLRAGLLMAPDLMTRITSQHAFGDMREEFRDREQRMIYSGQPAVIRVDAYPNVYLKGHVKSIATVADKGEWSSADVKVYKTIVSIDEPLEGIKPGMSAQVTIQVADALENVLTIPVQAIVGSVEMGSTRKCFVMTPQGPVEREIVVGMSNGRMAEVKSGLQEGDDVITNPKVLVGDKEKTREASAKTEGGKGEGGEKGKSGKGGGKGGNRGGKGKGGPQPGGAVPPQN